MFNWTNTRSSGKPKSPADLIAAKARSRPDAKRAAASPGPAPAAVQASSALGKLFGWHQAPRPTTSGTKRARELRTDLSDLSQEQQRVVAAALEGRNVFFTGSAGTGKSFTLNRVIACLRERHDTHTVHVTASTGVAATHIGGTTLHSFAGVGLGNEAAEALVKKVRSNKVTRERWQQATVLVLDEISMISAEFFTKLDHIGKVVRANERPFGGLQLVLCGDFLQLPSVDKNGGFIFDCPSWKAAIHETIELHVVFRQRDDLFISLLQSLRRGYVSDEHDAILRARLIGPAQSQRGGAVLNEIRPTKLYSHRANVDAENAEQLNKLPGAVHVYRAVDSGPQQEMAAKNFIVPSELVLKEGAQVILLKNLEPPLLVNGSRGVVVGFEKPTEAVLAQDDRFRNGLGRQHISLNVEYPVVQFASVGTRTMYPESWNFERGLELLASRRQVPLMLGWCLSIHKAQGMTIENIETDISNCWDAGQAYVALSRATSLEGLRLLGYRRERIKADAHVLAYYDAMAAKQPQEEPRSKRAAVDIVLEDEQADSTPSPSGAEAPCSACSYLTAVGSNCEMCGELCSGPQWACVVCTVRNSTLATVCSACATSRDEIEIL